MPCPSQRRKHYILCSCGFYGRSFRLHKNRNCKNRPAISIGPRRSTITSRVPHPSRLAGEGWGAETSRTPSPVSESLHHQGSSHPPSSVLTYTMKYFQRLRRPYIVVSPELATPNDGSVAPLLPALSNVEGPALPVSTTAEVEPPCERERSKSTQAKSRAQPREPHARSFPRKSPITTHSSLLFANRGYAELEMVPSRCKQRATTLSNRGEMRVVEPLRRPSRTTQCPNADCPSAEPAVRARTVELTLLAGRTRMKFVVALSDAHWGRRMPECPSAEFALEFSHAPCGASR